MRVTPDRPATTPTAPTTGSSTATTTRISRSATGKSKGGERPGDSAGTSVSFATNDAAQWADWGVDYLKYDWYLNDVASTEAMAKALRDSGRDIV